MSLWENSLSRPSASIESPASVDSRRLQILGVPFDDLPWEAIRSHVRSWLNGDRPRHLVTPNPEMLLAAWRDDQLKAILQRADLSIVDGFGVQLASLLYGRRLRHRLPGTDVGEWLMALAEEEGSAVYLLGGAPGVARKTAEIFRQRFPKLRITGASDGGMVTTAGQVSISVVNAIAACRPTMLAVAFGHGKQERFIANYLPHLPSVRVAIGVGGAFDYWSGTVRRAPRWLRRGGLEWLYRLARQPHRLTRVLRATVIFPAAAFCDSIAQHVSSRQH